MKRVALHLDAVADRDHLAWAFWRAALGKRHRREVQEFAANLDANLDRLSADLLTETVEVGQFRRFEILDPKRRVIHAPVFRERVLHHALMAFLEPVIDRYLLADTYACRPGKGSLTAVERAQQHSRRWPWYLKLDIRRYFASIDHATLKSLLRRRFKGRKVLRLIDRILDSFEVEPGRGLPIGALTSQHFANLYLAPLDRHAAETLRVPAFVRYMDDLVLWHRDRQRLIETLAQVSAFAQDQLHLEIKPTWQLQRSTRGLTLCGFRVHPGRLGLSPRRRRRYRQARAKWERAYLQGRVDGPELQAGYAAALGIVDRADSLRWRRQELARQPAIEA